MEHQAFASKMYNFTVSDIKEHSKNVPFRGPYSEKNGRFMIKCSLPKRFQIEKLLNKLQNVY